MKTIFLFILVSTLLLLPCSAEEISFEILQNSNDEYYISYNDDLIACANDTCSFNLSNYTTNASEIELSRNDMKKIAQYVALEIDIPEYTGSVNESFIKDSNIELRNELMESIDARNKNSFVPSVEEINAVKANLSAAQTMIADLKSKANEYDSLKETKDETISVLKDENSTMKYLCGILTLSFIAVLGFNSSSAKRLLELKRRKQ